MYKTIFKKSNYLNPNIKPIPSLLLNPNVNPYPHLQPNLEAYPILTRYLILNLTLIQNINYLYTNSNSNSNPNSNTDTNHNQNFDISINKFDNQTKSTSNHLKRHMTYVGNIQHRISEPSPNYVKLRNISETCYYGPQPQN